MTVYGLAELARAAGVKPRTMSGYLARRQCPDPDVRLESGPVWFAETVEAWIAKRDNRVETIIEAETEAFERDVDDVFHATYARDKRETAKRNVRNGRRKRAWGSGRAGMSLADLHRTGLLEPTVKEETRKHAERVVIGQGGNTSRLDWAIGIRQSRQANRVGSEDGIPW